MLRKLTVFVCLISFSPAAVGAQELAAIAGSPLVVDMPSSSLQQGKDVNLSLPITNRYPVDKLASAEKSSGYGAAMPDETTKGKKSGMTFKEWAEIHFGENRWVWWAGATAALVALHAFVFVDHK